MGSLGPVELFILFAITSLLPAFILYRVADSKGASKMFALWGLLLGWLGLIIGLVLLVTRKEPRPTGGF